MSTQSRFQDPSSYGRQRGRRTRLRTSMMSYDQPRLLHSEQGGMYGALNVTTEAPHSLEPEVIQDKTVLQPSAIHDAAGEPARTGKYLNLKSFAGIMGTIRYAAGFLSEFEKQLEETKKKQELLSRNEENLLSLAAELTNNLKCVRRLLGQIENSSYNLYTVISPGIGSILPAVGRPA